jgi:hypothetical protein
MGHPRPAQHREMPMTRHATRLPYATVAAAVTLALASGAALTQSAPRLKPGLWEHSFEMSDQSGQMASAMKEAREAMANMPPEQRKMMEQMMAKQGVSFDASGQKMRICMTPEDVARDQIPAAQEGCTQNATRSGNTWTVTFQCPARAGRPASSGRGTVTLRDSTAYSGNFTTTTEGANKKPEQVTMKTEGRWVSADCGAIKPIRR